jgi:hypothetical protein
MRRRQDKGSNTLSIRQRGRCCAALLLNWRARHRDVHLRRKVESDGSVVLARVHYDTASAAGAWHSSHYGRICSNALDRLLLVARLRCCDDIERRGGRQYAVGARIVWRARRNGIESTNAQKGEVHCRLRVLAEIRHVAVIAHNVLCRCCGVSVDALSLDA